MKMVPSTEDHHFVPVWRGAGLEGGSGVSGFCASE